MEGLEESIQKFKNEENDQKTNKWKEIINSLKILFEGCDNFDIITK